MIGYWTSVIILPRRCDCPNHEGEPYATIPAAHVQAIEGSIARYSIRQTALESKIAYLEDRKARLLASEWYQPLWTGK